jgi:citrate synthase
MVAIGRGLAGGIVDSLQQGWSLHGSQTTALLNVALILCADHELNVSSFTARCVASAGSTPYAVVMGGLAALQGHKHGGYTERVEALFREAGAPSGARAAIASRLKRGEGIPGFGHRLYPDGDPRGQALLQMVSAVYPGRAAVALAQAIVSEVAQATGARPNLDFGLVALARALALPPGTALALFALGRTIGWLGQAMEQYQRDQMIRPRARYVGPQPEP